MFVFLESFSNFEQKTKEAVFRLKKCFSYFFKVKLSESSFSVSVDFVVVPFSVNLNRPNRIKIFSFLHDELRFFRFVANFFLFRFGKRTFFSFVTTFFFGKQFDSILKLIVKIIEIFWRTLFVEQKRKQSETFLGRFFVSILLWKRKFAKFRRLDQQNERNDRRDVRFSFVKIFLNLKQVETIFLIS